MPLIHPSVTPTAAALALVCIGPAASASIMFNTANANPNTTVVNATTATVVKDGVTLTAVALGGDLNTSATGLNLFGIVGNGAGTISDSSEVLAVSFSEDVFLEQIDLNQLGNGETATISIPSLSLDFTVLDDGTSIVLTPAGGSAPTTGIAGGATTGGSADTVNFTPGSFALAAGSIVNISVLDDAVAPATDSSVALERITVATVPEPASLVLLGVGALAAVGRSRRGG